MHVPAMYVPAMYVPAMIKVNGCDELDLNNYFMFFLEKNVDGSCAPLIEVFENMEKRIVSFIVPVNNGKTMSLIEAYY